REEAFAGTETERAPDLTLVLRDRGFISVLNSDRVLRPRPAVMGTHHPEGVFVAAGPGVRRGARLEPLRIEQVTPLLLHALGIPIPADLDGRFPAAVLDDAALAADPPRAGPPTLPPDPFADERAARVEPADEEQVLVRLQALGYLE
ncbi:MAG TPA: hypothetical protein VFJ82_17470, partial [Longimicrobium sp.]|nr:hypothetical protein [Longimicrobium sp.]